MCFLSHSELLGGADQGRLSEGECVSEPEREGTVQGPEWGGGAAAQHSQAVRRARKGGVAQGGGQACHFSNTESDVPLLCNPPFLTLTGHTLSEMPPGLCAEEERRGLSGAPGTSRSPTSCFLQAVQRELPYLRGFLERLAVEASYSSAIHGLVVPRTGLVGLPFELGTVAGLVNHLVIWGLVLGLGFDWFHRLDVCPCSEFIPVSQRKHQ